MANIEEKVEKLIQKPINNIGYELYDIEYVKEGRDYFLRIFIEKEGGISLEDCEKVNNEITDLLDKQEFLKEQYFLEVSSTGIEKNLRKDKHLESNIGAEVELKLFRQINKKKVLTGILKSFNSNEIIIETNENENENIQRKDISQIKTLYHWEKQ